jgi:hypothetical protein
MTEIIKTASAVKTALSALRKHPEWYVFKLPQGRKKPPPENMLNDGVRPPGATNDPAAVAKWNSAINVGIAPNASRLVFMDVDTKPGKKGAATFAALIEKHGPLPRTLTVETPSGGLHYWFYETFEVVHRFGVNAFGPDVDCPQYVLMPGSVFFEDGKFIGRYTVVDQSPIADAPEWFAEYLQQRVESPSIGDNDAPAVDLDQPQNIVRAIEYLKNDAPPSIEGSNGDKTLLMVMATLKDMGISETKSIELIDENYNVDGKCIPVWTSEECATKARNAWAYLKETQPGADTAEAEFEADDTEEAVASATKADTELRKKKQAKWNSLRKDYVYVTQQEVFVSRTQISPSNSAPAMYSVRGFDRKFGYVKRELELGRTPLTEHIFSRLPGTGLDFFESFCYMPNKPENFEENLNLWRKSGVEPKQGDVRWFHEHVTWLFADDAKHVLDWMAWVYRFQHLHPKHALITHGEHQGTGKSVINNTMRRLLGSSNCTLLDQSALELDHDAWKVRTKFLMIEEIRPGFGSSNGITKKLHPLISEDTVHVDMKNRNDFDMQNVMAVSGGSNKPDALTMDDSDRRYLVVSTDRDGVVLKPKPIAYYRTIYGKDGVGGYLNDDAAMAAVAFDLLNRPLGDYSAQGPAPFTAAKGRMIEAGGSALQKWMIENSLNARVVNVNQIVKRIEADASDIVRKHRGDIRADIEDVLRRKFNGRSIKQQIRPKGRSGGKVRIWAIGADAETTATLSEGKLNAIYRADCLVQTRAQSEFDDGDGEA